MVNLSLPTRLRRLLIRAVLPLAWRGSRPRTAEALYRFATTEVDSAWQNLHALRSVSDVAIRAKMFQHVLEEMHHGALFRKLGDAYADRLLPLVLEEREPLWKAIPEAQALRSFYTYEHVAEVSVRDEFSAYADASPHEDVRRLFERLRNDEEGHARYTHEVCNQLMASPQARSREELRIKLERLWQAGGRVGARVALVPSTVLLSAVYYVFGALGVLLRRPRDGR